MGNDFQGHSEISDPERYDDARLQKVSGYVTDLLTDRARGFTRQQRNSQRPYVPSLTHQAVHPEAIQHHDGCFAVVYGTHYIPAKHTGAPLAKKSFPERTSPELPNRGHPAV